MAEETPEPSVDITPPSEDMTEDRHRMGVIGAVAKRFIEQMYFRNVLAVMMVATLCWKEVQGIPLSEHFYMLAALVVGMYFPSGEKGRA